MGIRYGAVIGNRQMLFDNRVQQSLSMTRYKRLNNQVGEISLNGLDIDWHLAEYDYPALPIGNVESTYAYA